MQETVLFRQMRQALSRWVDIQDREWGLLEKVFRVKTLAKGENALNPGTRPWQIYFVCSGLLRYFYQESDGKQTTKLFLAENMFTDPLTGCPLGLGFEPGCGIQALEPTVVLVAETNAFATLYDMHPIFDRLSRKICEEWLLEKEARTRSLLLQDASGRYLDFIRLHGELAQRVPLYHIASYLGVTDVSLSRIRKGLSRKPLPSGMRALRPAPVTHK